MATTKKNKIDGDRNVLISGRLAFPEPEFDEGQVRESDRAFETSNYHTGIVVRPDGSLALKGWPPAPPAPAAEEEDDPDADKSEQQKAVERSEAMKSDPETRKAPFQRL